MRLYPALDLRRGRVVRLAQGDPVRETAYGDDPLAQARAFARAGFTALHIVDLDAALEGPPADNEESPNRRATAAIAAESPLELGLGGGLRSEEGVRAVAALGVRRLIVSTLAVREPLLFARLCRELPGRIWVSVDLRGERVADAGWCEESDLPWRALLARAEEAGAAGVLRTEILRDGTGEGVDAERVAAFARATSLPVVAAGGVASLADLEALKATGALAGAVLGRALYDGSLSLEAAAAWERAQQAESAGGAGGTERAEGREGGAG